MVDVIVVTFKVARVQSFGLAMGLVAATGCYLGKFRPFTVCQLIIIYVQLLFN